MNTPRQPNVRTPIEQIPGRIRNSEDPTSVPTSFITGYNSASKAATRNATPSVPARVGTPEAVTTIRTTGS
jgi:hypothetical protein